MAIVLEVSLTLNPGNQIAYLSDDTGLIVGTEYVIAGTHLAADTRFTYNGNLDIVLTKQPIAVPTNNYLTPVSINTVPLAAPAPPVATYPYSVKNQLAAANLNHDLEFSPGPLPPQSALGGAGRFKYWIDTSTPLPTLRQCVVARASVAYVATDWITLGTIDAASHKFHFNTDTVDFSGGSSTLNLTNVTVSGSSNLTTVNVSGVAALHNTTVTGTLSVTGAATLPTITGPTTLSGPTTLAGATTMTGGLTVPAITYSGTLGHATAIDWDGAHARVYIDGSVHGYVPSVLPVLIAEGGTAATTAAQALANLGGFPITGGNVNGSLGVTGNFSVTGQSFFSGTEFSGDISSSGTITGNVLTSSNAVNALVLQGGPNNAGTLRCWNTAHTINFKWDNLFVYWRIDEAQELRICTHQNAWDFNHASGGGPTGRQLYYKDNSSNVYSIYVDIVSDDRIKRNIAPTSVDALAVLQQVPVCEFDVDGRVVAWLQTSGQDDAARRQAMDRAKPARIGIGFVSQDVQRVIPEAVTVVDQTGASPDSPLPVKLHNIVQQNFVPYLVRAVQQLTERLEALEGAR